MNEPGASKHIPPSMSDERLIQELEFWGEGKHADAHCSALEIQRQVLDRRRKSLRLTLVACSIFSATILSTAWLPLVQRQDAGQKNARQNNSRPTEVAMEKTPIDFDPELLMKSIAQRTQEINARIEELKFGREQQRLAVSEIRDLNARLLHYRRIAFRNAIVLNQIP